MKNENVWIKWYKIIVKLSVAAIILLGFILGVDAAESRYGDFLDFLLYFVPAVFIAAFDLVMGMLIASFFENIQAIRDKLENM